MAKFKFAKALRRSYAQIPQPNPISWTLYYLNEEGILEPQSASFKCRDFFNDIVAKVHGKSFAIYGFTNDIKMNDEGVYVLLKSVKPSLRENLDKWLKSYLETVSGQEFGVFETERSTQLLLKIPTWFFEKTYYISLATLLIRLCNYGEVFDSVGALLANGTTPRSREYAILNESTVTKLLKFGFKVPPETEKYWWFSHPSVHNERPEDYATTTNIHNAGIKSWLMYVGN